MYKVKRLLKKLFAPVTIMLIPHNGKRTVNLKVPSIGIAAATCLCLVGTAYVTAAALNTVEYYDMKAKLSLYGAQLREMRSSLMAVKKAEAELLRLLSFGSKEKIMEHFDARVTTSDAGSLDMDLLKEQIRATVDNVSSIKEYLKEQSSVYLATPRGLPIEGRVTSEFGQRENPREGGSEFHSGIDLAASTGSPVKATANGVVSFAGWSGGNGNLVVVEHGFGYSTFYAHNKTLSVKVGDRVKRGGPLAFSGSTGNSTGPHVHYEVWQNGKSVNPRKFMQEAQVALTGGRR